MFKEFSKELVMSKKIHIKISSPKWWQTALILTAIILAIKLDVSIVNEVLKKYLSEYLSR